MDKEQEYLQVMKGYLKNIRRFIGVEGLKKQRFFLGLRRIGTTGSTRATWNLQSNTSWF